MFEQITDSQSGGRRRWTTLAALAGQVALIALLIVIPVFSVQQLPLEAVNTILIAPPPPPPPPPPPAPAAATAPHVAHVAPKHFDAHELFAPKVVPKTIAAVPDLPQAPAEAAAVGGVTGGIAGGVMGGTIGGVLGGVLGGVPSSVPAPPPPPPAPPAAPATPKLIRVGGNVQAAKVISAPTPAYPVLAKEAHVGGVVALDAVIGTDGHIENLKVISGSPLLIEAAMKAVKQWTYKPTILNGQPIKIETQILVTFQLNS